MDMLIKMMSAPSSRTIREVVKDAGAYRRGSQNHSSQRASITREVTPRVALPINEKRRCNSTHRFWNQIWVCLSTIPSNSDISFLRAAVGLRSIAKKCSRWVSCSGVTRERLRFSFSLSLIFSFSLCTVLLASGGLRDVGLDEVGSDPRVR